jgi:hypothetical protein
MSRSSDPEHASRLNAAWELFRSTNSISGTVQALSVRFNISVRQAYRYAKMAKDTGGATAIPEAKHVFTVKLPASLIDRVRQRAKDTGRSISDIVTDAMRLFLSEGY